MEAVEQRNEGAVNVEKRQLFPPAHLKLPSRWLHAFTVSVFFPAVCSYKPIYCLTCWQQSEKMFLFYFYETQDLSFLCNAPITCTDTYSKDTSRKRSVQGHISYTNKRQLQWNISSAWNTSGGDHGRWSLLYCMKNQWVFQTKCACRSKLSVQLNIEPCGQPGCWICDECMCLLCLWNF